MTYDAIVVGAGCAGAATAMLLACKGARVLLLERQRFPADTMSTLYIQQPGVALLDQWDVLRDVQKSGCPPITDMRYHVEDVRLESRMPKFQEQSSTYAPRRFVLDQILVAAGGKAGIDFSDQCRCTGLLWRDGRVSGVQFRTSGGRVVSESASLVVGADGMRSTVAALASAPVTVSDPLASCVYYSTWSGVDTGFGFYERQGHWVAVIPTHDGVTMIATYRPQTCFLEIRRDAVRAHMDTIRHTAPEVFEATSEADLVDRLRGTGDQQNFFRQPRGPGWALVGDAGHHRDSITALGITNALTQAQLLADAVGNDLADSFELARDLDRFASARDREMMKTYQSTLECARLQVSAPRLALLRGITAVPDLTERYFAVIAGILPMENLFTPELMAALT